MSYKTILLVLVSLAIVSCKRQTENTAVETTVNENNHETDHEKAHWTYDGETGPEHWVEIEKQADCDGKQQSPINIIDVDAVEDTSLKPLNIYYSKHVKIHDVTNNGHTIQYNFERGDYIDLSNEIYELKQIHFHEASEHTINGVRYPVEMHMVHVAANNKIAVLAVMVQEGKSSEPFIFLENYLPVQIGETKLINSTFDVNLNLPENNEYYTYSGSLTTPPCTESVSWYVFKSPITISLKQVKQLQALMPLNNYRNEQPINGRIVKHFAPRAS